MASDSIDVEDPASPSADQNGSSPEEEEESEIIDDSSEKVKQEHGQQQEEGGEMSPSKVRCWHIVRFFLGGLLGLVFCYSVVVQFNDVSGIGMWALFYLLHLFVAILGLLNQEKLRVILLLAAVAGFIWAFILMIVASIALSGTEKGGMEEGGDNNSATDREEKAFELGGAILGLLSGVYHIFMFKSPAPTSKPELSAAPTSQVS